MLPPTPPQTLPPHTRTHTHTHGCESTQKHCGVHPGPSQQNFPATPIQAPCPHRLSYKTPPTLRPTQSPLQSLKPALPPRPPYALHSRPVNLGLCPEHSAGRQPRPPNEWTGDPRTVRESSREHSYQLNVVKLICSSGEQLERTIHVD